MKITLWSTQNDSKMVKSNGRASFCISCWWCLHSCDIYYTSGISFWIPGSVGEL